MTINIRIWGLACGAAAVAVLAGGWFIGVQPQLSAAAQSAQSATTVETQNQATMIRLAGLSKLAAKQDSMQAENAVLLKSVPTILKPNTFIRRINEVAALDGVDVVSVTLSDAVVYTPPVPATTSGQPAPKLAATNPLISANNMAVVPATVVVSGDEGAVLQFNHDIQNDERVFSINGVQNAKNEGGAGVTSSLTGYIYTLKR